MQTAIQGFQTFGRMYRPDALKNEIKEQIPYAHATDIVDGLFEKQNAYIAFENWCRKVSEINLQQGLNK